MKIGDKVVVHANANVPGDKCVILERGKITSGPHKKSTPLGDHSLHERWGVKLDKDFTPVVWTECYREDQMCVVEPEIVERGYWYVMVVGEGQPKYQHVTEESAITESKRLAMQFPGKECLVMNVVGSAVVKGVYRGVGQVEKNPVEIPF